MLVQGGQYYPTPYQMPPPAVPPASAPALVAVPQEQLLQTATIRNAVNLKKNSLALVPVDGNPRRLAVTFTFDSSVPCRRAPSRNRLYLCHGRCVTLNIASAVQLRAWVATG